MDRGYNDYSLFAWLLERGATFVTRLKDNAVTMPCKRVPQRGWQLGRLPVWIRLPDLWRSSVPSCQWNDKGNDWWYDCLTNDKDLKPEEIAALGKKRWQIELFFMKIKQNMKIKSFIGSHDNAVMRKNWTAAIVTLLNEVPKQRCSHKWSLPRLLHFVFLNPWHTKVWEFGSAIPTGERMTLNVFSRRLRR